MTGNISYLSDYEPYDRGYVSFGRGGRDFKLKDDTNVLLRTPKQHNMYSIDLNNIVPHKDPMYSTDESMLWHRRLGHLNFKTMNKLVRHNLVKGLPSKCFENDHTYVACLKEKQHKATCKTKLVNSVSKSLLTLHMDLFGPTSVSSLNHKWYCLVVTDDFLGTKDVASQDVKKDVSSLRYIALPNWFHEAHLESSTSNSQDACNADAPESSGNSNPTATSKNPPADQMETLTVEYAIPTVSSPVPTACLDDSPEPSSTTRLISKRVTSQDETPSLDNISTLSNRFEDILRVTTNTGDTNRVEANLGNMEYNISASLTPTFRIFKDHPKSQIIGPVDTLVQTRHKSNVMEEQSFIATIHQKTTPDLLQFCLFLCFLSQEEPKKIFDALKDPSWVKAMQKELLQFKIQNVWIFVDCPKGEEGIDYEEVFAPVARIEAIRLFLAYASFMGFTDPEFPDRVYKVEKAVYGLHQAPRAWYGTLSKYLLANGFQRDVGSANTPMDKENPWGKDRPGKDVDLHLYRSMIGSLMYLTVSRPNIRFAVYACARHQVTPKECHLHAVKRIFINLKGYLKLGLWYPKESPFDLVAYSDSDYSGATQDRKSTTGGCQFLGRRLILWQCKKHTIVATSTTEAEYVPAANDNVADLLTKPFDAERFQYLVGEGSGTPTKPHHTPSLEVQQSPHHDLSSSLHPTETTATIPTTTPTEIPTLRQYSRRATWIAQSKALPSTADEHASLLRDDSQGEAFPTVSDLEAGQDRENIIKTSALPHDSTPRVTSLDVDEGDLEISSLKARIKFLKDKDKGTAELSGDDAPIKGRSLETMEEASVERSTERGISDVGVPTSSGLVPTSDTPKKKKLQEQIDVQMAREMEEKMAREDERMDEQIARDAEIGRIHTEKELQMLIDVLDRNNEVIAKNL
uniref:Ribonuclease H-like domain, reverse transcriptase, RNA-dependent DNA polymerase n=1 Tax=Tanacetum cinerariifolium TaxID=118510 RepID=A0A6L2JEV3_TANCI|nr:ribonuclease H-like domain, reverse transcriptase, RNA-dependent DNA polymerase [Tanacetum cinerariifolium]